MKTILIVDDHPLVFHGIQGWAEKSGFTLLLAQSLEAALAMLATEPVEACIIDISLGKSSGLALLKSIPATMPCFILTMHNSRTLAVQAQALGARGYFLKDEPLDLLFEALKDPDARDFWQGTALAPLHEGAQGHQAGFDSLTQREQQVFILMAEGLGYKEIGTRLGISPKTVNVFKDNIMKKMQLDSLADAVKVAILLGLVVI